MKYNLKLKMKFFTSVHFLTNRGNLKTLGQFLNTYFSVYEVKCRPQFDNISSFPVAFTLTAAKLQCVLRDTKPRKALCMFVYLSASVYAQPPVCMVYSLVSTAGQGRHLRDTHKHAEGASEIPPFRVKK